MARVLRLSFENAFYHITTRGRRKENIFYSDKDKKVFLEKIKNKIDSLGQNREVSCIKDVSLPSKERIMDIISKQFKVEKDAIFEKRRGNIYRKLTLYFLKKYSELSLKRIGELFDMDYVAVSQAAKRFENEMKRNKIALRMAKEVAGVLKEEMNVKC